MRRYVVLYAPRKDGSCMAIHCQAKAQATIGEWVWPEEYPLPEIPEMCAELWEWYWELREACTSGMAGQMPLQWSEIVAWQALFNIQLTPYMVWLLHLLDKEYLYRYGELTKK